MGTCSFEASDASGDSAIDPELRAGLAAAGRGAVVAGKSAALAHGPDLITTVATHEFAVPRNRSHRVPGLVVRRADLRPHEITSVDGLRVTSVVRTLADVARYETLVEAVVAADSALRSELITVHELHATLRTLPGGRGSSRVRRAWALVDPRSGSALETRARVLMALARLPRPVTQLVIYDRQGQFLARVDFAFVEARVIVETDGYAYHNSRESFLSDRIRLDELARLGWTLIRLTWEDIVLRPDWVIQLLRDLGV